MHVIIGLFTAVTVALGVLLVVPLLLAPTMQSVCRLCQHRKQRKADLDAPRDVLDDPEAPTPLTRAA